MSDTTARVPAGTADAETALGYLLNQDWDLLGTPEDTDDPAEIRKNNTRRAGWALRAVKGYADITASDGSEPVGDQIRYLLADLAHLCDALGMDFDATAEQALRNYYREEAAGRP